MAAGFGLLRLSTHEFWAMTPREICAAFAPPTSAGATRPLLEQMMRAFPDELMTNEEPE